MDVKISVIIPIYKTELYIRRCVDSVLSQTYGNLEIILVDDGSPDGCPAICDEYQAKDSRVRVIHQANQGLSAARNAGLDMATGEYIGFVDSDDYVDPRMYEILLNHIQKENADLVICNYAEFYGDNITETYSANTESEVLTSRQAMFRVYCRDSTFWIVAWNKLYHRNIFREIRYPVGKINEDLFIIYPVLDIANKIVITNEVLYYYYRGNSESITTEFRYLYRDDAYEAIESAERFCAEKGYTELFPHFCGLYLSQILVTCRGISYKATDTKDFYKENVRMFRLKYKANKKYIKELRFDIFYYFPVLYFKFEEIRNRWLKFRNKVKSHA